MAGDGPLILGWAADLVAIGIGWSDAGQKPGEAFWLLLIVAIIAGVAALDNAQGRTERARPAVSALAIACVLTALVTGGLALGAVPGSAAGLAR